MVVFHPEAEYRASKRGLVVAGPAGVSGLVEHPLATRLPELVRDDPTHEVLLERLGPGTSPDLIRDLIDIGVLTERPTARVAQAGARVPSIELTRSGLMLSGIDRPAAWLARRILPAIISLPGRICVVALVVGGIAALLSGRPDVPEVSASPAAEAGLMLVLGILLTVLHELAHAVVLAHFGKRPGRAGFGFYWGALSFFVDSSAGMTLDRRKRVVQALAGLALDAVATAVLAVGAHLVADPLLAIVFWRLAILGLLDILLNLAPVLEVDGHWALADLLDEPDLAPRARRALGAALRGSLPQRDRPLAAYGAISLLAGLALLVISVPVFWFAAGDLLIALLSGSVLEIALGLYFIGPFVVGLVASAVGLTLETIQGIRREGVPVRTSP